MARFKHFYGSAFAATMAVANRIAEADGDTDKLDKDRRALVIAYSNLAVAEAIDKLRETLSE